MKAVLQRVANACVRVDGETIGAIDRGLLILLGVAGEDGPLQAKTLAAKIAVLRIFEDEQGRLNRSLLDLDYSALVVSNFTLYGDCARGRRPDFTRAAGFETARGLYERFLTELGLAGVGRLASGRFGADMQVELINDGPVTIIVDTDDLRQL